MKLKIVKFILFVLLFSIFFSFSYAHGKRYKIGYIEGGEYWLFDHTFASLKKAVDEKGWTNKIIFPENARVSPGWDKLETLNKNAEDLMARKDLDLIISAGTDATSAILKKNNNKTPIIALAVSSPLKSGFIKTLKDSGIDNFTTRVVEKRFERMFIIFHGVVGFKNLGLIYPDTENGRKYTNLKEAKNIASSRNFKISEFILKQETTADCLKALEHLIKKDQIDAFFIPSLLPFDLNKGSVDKILSFLRKNKIATFARNGSRYVKAGALMGFSSIDFTARGNFLANQLISILNGTKPRALNMIDNAVPKISFNLKTASEINFDPSFDFLGSTDEIFTDIEPVKP